MSNLSLEKPILLAFSGGLDTSFCVPYLIEQGYRVTTVFVDSGGVTPSQKQAIEKRSIQLGAAEHIEMDITQKLWQQIITPLIWGGYWYQNQYPLLCSDRYLIVQACLEVCQQKQIQHFAHGCSGMGNDQIRFDIAAKCLGDYQIVAPVRELLTQTNSIRQFEIDYLQARGFTTTVLANHYSINENLMGVTMSGSEIDGWLEPDERSYKICAPPTKRSSETKKIRLNFYQGRCVGIDDYLLGGGDIMKKLNAIGGSYGVGRGIYTGDTTIGLKGRIVFEAPAINLLQIAHTALEQAIVSKSQNRFKSTVASKWTELVYEGLFFDPLKNDLEAYLATSQKHITGQVTLLLSSGNALAVAIESNHIAVNRDAVYAQSADWNGEQARGFIQLFGQSSYLSVKNQRKSVNQEASVHEY